MKLSHIAMDHNTKSEALGAWLGFAVTGCIMITDVNYLWDAIIIP